MCFADAVQIAEDDDDLCVEVREPVSARAGGAIATETKNAPPVRMGFGSISHQRPECLSETRGGLSDAFRSRPFSPRERTRVRARARRERCVWL